MTFGEGSTDEPRNTGCAMALSDSGIDRPLTAVAVASMIMMTLWNLTEGPAIPWWIVTMPVWLPVTMIVLCGIGVLITALISGTTKEF